MPAVTPMAGGMPVQILQVSLTCTYAPALGATFMTRAGIGFMPLVAQGAMPLQQ